MSDPRRFDARELASAEPGGDAELGQALATGRELEAAVAGIDPRPARDLADRIMAAVAAEPAPALGILSALGRRPGLRGLADSLRLAWRRALTSGRPATLRAGALAYVAAVAILALSLTGAAAYTTAGALGLFAPPASHEPVPTPGLRTPLPVASPEPSEAESAEPSERPEPSGTVEPSEDHATSSQEPGDDHSDAPGVTTGGSSGGDGGSGTETPKPSQADGPSESQQSGSGPSDG